MKTLCPPGYHHNGFVETHALGHMMYGFIYIAHDVRFHVSCIYIYIYLSTLVFHIFENL